MQLSNSMYCNRNTKFDMTLQYTMVQYKFVAINCIIAAISKNILRHNPDEDEEEDSVPIPSDGQRYANSSTVIPPT